MTKIFKPILGHTIEVYTDDKLDKSRRLDDHIQDLGETFGLLRQYGIKLNPLKCVFGVGASKFLGFLVTKRGPG